MAILIPVRFYGFDSVMYFASAIIGFLISYYSFKLFKITSKKHHLYLYSGFTILSMGLLALAITTTYVYLNYYEQNQFTFFDTILYADDFGYWIYYMSSFMAYVLFVLMYVSEDLGVPILIPAWYKGFPYFHIVSFFLLSYVVFRNATNYAMKRNKNSLLVTLGFGLIAGYHFLLFFTSFSKIVYVIAHLSLLLGFSSLLLMLIRVTRK
ncbi:MAG TPA: hypothetical protein VJ343_02125 [archaeon]|nr:hypothetical protein [archaeon]